MNFSQLEISDVPENNRINQRGSELSMALQINDASRMKLCG